MIVHFERLQLQEPTLSYQKTINLLVTQYLVDYERTLLTSAPEISLPCLNQLRANEKPSHWSLLKCYSHSFIPWP